MAQRVGTTAVQLSTKRRRIALKNEPLHPSKSCNGYLNPETSFPVEEGDRAPFTEISQHYEIAMNQTIVQQPPLGDTSFLRQIPGTDCQQVRTLSPETIARLREARKLRRSVEFTQAVEQACHELGIKPPVERKGGKGTYSIKQAVWNQTMDAIDAACSDWRGYTVQVDHNVSQWVAA